MEAFLNHLVTIATTVTAKILLAVVVYAIGSFIIKSLVKALEKGKLFSKVEGSVKTFALSCINIGLYVLLVISVINILGVPMTSVITVLASAGVAIGLALQGALTNLAGGIMLMAFKPFKQGDYVEAGGAAGIVHDVTLFYTTFLTWDNQRVTVPNGALMNSNITNYSSEELRRVDLSFSCAKSETPADIQNIIMNAITKTEKTLSDPAPFARLSGSTNESMEFAARAWCKNEDYWDVYFNMTQNITEALIAAGVKAPAIRVLAENK